MLTISNLSLFFGERKLFDNINFTIKDNDKIGITGKNGAGKTTLFKVILGEMTPDIGEVVIPNNKSVGYLSQEIDLDTNLTVIDETAKAFDEINSIKSEIENLEKAISTREDYESDEYAKLVESLVTLNNQLSHHNSDQALANMEKVLKGLGFTDNDFGRKIFEFSGGWQIRIELAKILLKSPDYILLDEPTNHLDIEAIIWLEQYLQNYNGAILLISHDQRFLDNVTNKTIEIENSNIYSYPVPYTQYRELRKERIEKTLAAYKNQQAVIKEKEKTISRFMAKATKTKLAQSMQKQLDKIERIEVDEIDTSSITLRFLPPDRAGRDTVKIQNLTKSYDENTVLKNVNLLIERGEKVAFVGQNGQGKTTLAKIIADKLNYNSGTVQLGHNVKIGYYAQNQSDLLDGKYTVKETMENNATLESRTEIRKILGALLFSGEDVDKKVSVLSGGEKARLAIAVMLLRPFNLLIMDEPTNHLDITSKNVLKDAIKDYAGTVLIVSHDREFLSELTTKIIEFKDHKLKEYLGDINYFLEKRKLDDIRNIEFKSENSPKTEKKQSNSKRIYEERKQIQRDIKKIEKQIDKLEGDISKLEAEMLEPDFHTSKDGSEKMKRHKILKEELDTAMEHWELANEKLEGL